MAILYPRKQTVIIFIVCAVAVGGAAYANIAARPKAQAAQLIDAYAASKPTALEASVDGIDSASFSDWKKQFGSSTASYTDGSKPAEAAPQAPVTLTDRFGSQFMQNYMQLQQNGLSNDANALSVTADNLASNALSAARAAEYTTKEVTIVANNDQAALQAWSDGLVLAVSGYSIEHNEAVITNNAITQNDMTILKQIDPIIPAYKKIIAGLRKAPTPAHAVQPMLDLMNGVSQLEFGAESLRAIDTDAVRGALGVQAFTQGSAATITSLLTIKALLREQGIGFDFNPIFFNTLVSYQ